ncbi:MAG: hypothetical protein HYT71_03525 [Candidatus Aenigmarchaeota archaeon]|nr:hypothetical protein [Candidatus Aenigmarchaeota archaeon]
MNTERCPSCSSELVMFSDALGYVKPVADKCMKCGISVEKDPCGVN